MILPFGISLGITLAPYLPAIISFVALVFIFTRKPEPPHARRHNYVS